MTADPACLVRGSALVASPGGHGNIETRHPVRTLLQRFNGLIVLCSLAAAVAGCATAAQRFEQGTALESSGQRSEAVRRYSQALRKDPGHLESRQRLTVLAPAVLDGYLIQSANDARREAFIDAAEAVIAADGLHANMRALGITVAVPAGYASVRRERFEQAIGQSMREAQRATIEGQWALAMATYDKIAHFEPEPQQALRVQEARVDNLLQAAQAEYDSGHFRAALSYIERALEIPVAKRQAELHELHDQILYDGTQRVMFLPVSGLPHGAPAPPAPPGFVRSVDDALRSDHWHKKSPADNSVRRHCATATRPATKNARDV